MKRFQVSKVVVGVSGAAVCLIVTLFVLFPTESSRWLGVVQSELASRIAPLFPAKTSSPFEIKVNSIPLNCSAAEAEAFIGRKPTRVEILKGILASPTSFHAADTEYVKNYEKDELKKQSNDVAFVHVGVKNYELMIWHEEGLNGTVVLDENGKVVGRWTWK